MCQPELKYINLALINIHYLIVDEPDGGKIKLMYEILDTELLKFSRFLKVESEHRSSASLSLWGEFAHQNQEVNVVSELSKKTKLSAGQMPVSLH